MIIPLLKIDCATADFAGGYVKQIINIRELQADASQVVKRAEKGEVFEVMRYSKPVAILLSLKDYQNLHQECRGCVEHWREVTGKKLRKIKQ